MSKVTLKNIADCFSVSTNTVSKALRGLPGVNDDLRNEIYSKAIELGYDKVAPIIDTNSKNKNIGVLCRYEFMAADNFWPKVISGISSNAYKNNINISIHTIDVLQENSENPLDFANSIPFDGFIVIGTISDNFLTALSTMEIPFVILDHYVENIDCDFVLSNNELGIYRALKYLYDKNHRKIGFLNNGTYSRSFNERYNAYLKFMDLFNLEVDTNFVWSEGTYIETDYYKEKFKETFNDKGFPTAFVSVNDTTAITFIAALRELGMSVPKDVSVIGFDNVSELFYHGLTTIDVPKEGLGEEALNQIISRISNPTAPYKKIVLNTTLVERDSVITCK